MLNFLEYIFDVSGHGDVVGLGLVVQLQGGLLVPPSPTLNNPWVRRTKSCTLAAFQDAWLGPHSS